MLITPMMVNFQNRYKYLKALGFDNFKACNMGLNINCNMWPESDIEMIKATTNDYINSDKPFMTYYMTVQDTWIILKKVIVLLVRIGT